MTGYSRADARYKRLWLGVLTYLLIGASVNLLIGYLSARSLDHDLKNSVQTRLEDWLGLFRVVFHLLILAWLAHTVQLTDLLYPRPYDRLVQRTLGVSRSHPTIGLGSFLYVLGLGVLLSLFALLLFPDREHSLLTGIADAGEEIIFRGFLLGLMLRSFKSTRTGRWIAVILTSALFSGAHTFYLVPELNIERLSTIFILGAIFALVRLATASVVVPTFFHGYFNGGLLGGWMALFVYVTFLIVLLRLGRSRHVLPTTEDTHDRPNYR